VTSNSKYFDSIRIAPRKAKGLEEAPHLRETAKAKSSAPECEWEGCREPGLNRAPRGTSPDGLNGKVEKPYRLFCAKHVREFNHNYDFFQGMSDKDIAAFQRDALTGHRPTWGLGVNAASTPGGDRVGGRIPKGKKSLFRAKWARRTGTPRAAHAGTAGAGNAGSGRDRILEPDQVPV